MKKLNEIKEILSERGYKISFIAEKISVKPAIVWHNINKATRPNYFVIEAVSDFLEAGSHAENN